MERIHRKTRGYKDKIKQRGIVHSLLANAELQAKNKAFEEEP